MLIGGLPEDQTPSPKGMVPYSEDGIHLNFITIESIMGYGGGDGGGGGGFSEIDFPDGTKGYYSSVEPNVYQADSGDSYYMGDSGIKANKAYTYTLAKIARFPERYFAAYVKAGLYKDTDGMETKFINAPDSLSGGCVSLDILSYKNSDVESFTKNYTLGYQITNNDYADEISKNFPFLLYSSKQSIVKTTTKMTDYYIIVDDQYVPQEIIDISGGGARVPWSSWMESHWFLDPTSSNQYINSTTGLPKPTYLPSNWNEVFGKRQLTYETFDKKYPILHMAFERRMADRIYDTYRDDPDLGPDEYVGDIYLPPDNELVYGEDSVYRATSWLGNNEDGTGFPITYNNVTSYVVNGGGGSVKNYILDAYDVAIQQARTQTPYYDADVTAVMAAINNEDMYEANEDIQLHLKLWDIWSNEVYGVFCYHIIRDDDQEFLLYMDDKEFNHEWYPNLIEDGKLSEVIWDENWVYRNKETQLNKRDIYKDYTMWHESEGDINPLGIENHNGDHVKYFSSISDAMVWVNHFVLGINIDEPVASVMYGSNGGYGALVPTKRKMLYDWWLSRSSSSGPLNSTSDYMYGVNDVLKESYIGMRSVIQEFTSPHLIDQNNFMSGISFGNFHKIGYGIDSISDSDDHILEGGSAMAVEWATLHYLCTGGGGGGSDLPLVTNADIGKVLTVNDNAEWDKLTLPTYFGGHVDTGNTMDSWNETEHKNYILLGNGLHAEYETILNQNYLRLYGKASELNVGNCIDISSAKTGGFSVNKSTSSGVTTYALDISDIDKFQQLVAGTGIQISKSIDANNVRSYTIEATSQFNHLATNLNEAFKNNVHIESGAWRTLNTYAGGGSYHPSYWGLDTDSIYYIDVGLSFEVPANIAAGSYARLILSTYSDGDPTNVDKVLYSNQGEMTNIGRSSIFEDTRLLIPGVVNTLHFSGLVSIGSNNINNQLYFNMYHNAGVSLGYDTASGTPTVQLPIKLSGFAFKC